MYCTLTRLTQKKVYKGTKKTVNNKQGTYRRLILGVHDKRLWQNYKSVKDEKWTLTWAYLAAVSKVCIEHTQCL